MGTATADTAPETTPLGNSAAFEGGVQEVGKGAFAWIQPNGDLGESNAGLVVGDGESLLVDTLWDELLTRRMLDAFSPARRGAPIKTLFNTHGDGDHWFGNGLLGGAEIVATEKAAEQMADEPPALLTRMRPLPGIAGRLASVPLAPGKPRLRGLASFGKELSAYDFDGLEPRLPTRTFSGRLIMEVGGRPVELIEVGPAHTPGDAIAWVPDSRTVFSGDLVFNGVTPIMWAGPVENWISALETIIGLEPEAVVPGHGPVCDAAGLEDLLAYWRYLARHVPAGAGDAIVELTEELVLAAEYRTAPWGEWRLPQRSLVNITMVARERDGRGGPLSVRERIGLLAGMGALHERLLAAGYGA